MGNPNSNILLIYVDVITGPLYLPVIRFQLCLVSVSSKPEEIYFPVYSPPAESQAALCGAASEIYGAALSGALSRSHSDQTVQGVKSDGPTAEGGEPTGSVK